MVTAKLICVFVFFAYAKLWYLVINEPLHEKTCFNVQLINAFVFGSGIIQLSFLNQKFQALTRLLCTAQIVSDLVGNSDDRFSCDTSHGIASYLQVSKTLMISNIPTEKCYKNIIVQHFQ